MMIMVTKKLDMSIVVVIMIVIRNCYDCSSMKDEEGSQFVAYFTPTKAMEKRRAEKAAREHVSDYV